MQIWDEPYQRDQRRLQLARRMIQFDARTPTIQRWTLLSVYRIRLLRHAYTSVTQHEAALKGITPTRVEFFMRSSTVRAEAPMLAGFLKHFDVLPTERGVSVSSLPSLERGECFCTAYEHFHTCRPMTEISFEHAVLLLEELVRGVKIRLNGCTICGDLMLQDCLCTGVPSCAYCLRDANARLGRFGARKSAVQPATSGDGEVSS